MRPVIRATTLLLAALVSGWTASANAGRLDISYDATADRVSIQAEQASLSGLLARLALLTDIDVQMDPAAERPVSLVVASRPLEAALQTLLRPPLGSLLVQSQGADGSTRIRAINVYAPGRRDDGRLAPLLDLSESDALTQARLASVDGYVPTAFLKLERQWQSRFARMSAADQADYRKRKLQRLEQLRQAAADRHQRRLAARAAGRRAAARVEATLAELARTDPAAHAEWLRQRDQLLRERGLTER